MDEILEDITAWVDGGPTRSVSMVYRHGRWEIDFNAQMMVPVRVRLEPEEGLTQAEALRSLLTAGLIRATH